MERKVIIADDNEDSRTVYASMIANRVGDVEVVQVAEGGSLVEKVRGGGFSLVLTDNEMPPGMDGLKAIRTIRQFDDRTPIYMISGSEVGEEAIKAGANGYIEKGRNVAADLKEVIAKHLL